MIKYNYYCDLCGSKVEQIESIVLYRTTLDYCKENKECRTKAINIKRAMAETIKYYEEEKNRQISKAEKGILGRYK